VLPQRIVTALALISALFYTLFFSSSDAFKWIMLVVFMIAAYEWSSMFVKAFKMGALAGAGLMACFVASFAAGLTLHWQQSPFFLMVIAGTWWLYSILLVCRYPRGVKFWQTSPLCHAIFGLLTVVPPFFALLYLFSFSSPEQPWLGQMFIGAVFLITICADTGAYFVGKKFGKTKLIPNVSPNKTVEGLLGGMIFTLIVFLVYWNSFQDSLLKGSILVLVTAFYSVMGDLLESTFKRHAQIKDSGRILPGHGGVLDRIDSLTAALPVFTLLFILLGYTQ
jgi:phosphatidate cytidylyltransferase